MEGYRFATAPRISIRPDYSLLFLVSTKPPLDNVTEFSSPESILTLYLSYRPPPNGARNWTIAGDLILFDENKVLLNFRNCKFYDF